MGISLVLRELVRYSNVVLFTSVKVESLDFFEELLFSLMWMVFVSPSIA